MKKIIIGLVGPLASGKEVVKKYLEKKYQAKSYKFSTPLRDTLTRLYLPISRKNLQHLSLDLRQRFGKDILAKVITQDANTSSSKLIIIDGARRLADIEHLQPLSEFKLIAINADPYIRYKRMLKRNENKGDKEKTFAQFEEDNKREAEKEIPQVMAIANYTIYNNQGFTELYRQIDNIIAKITSYDK